MHRYYRPEDISADLAYPAGWWDLYAPAPAPAAAQPVGGGKSAAAQEQEQTGPTSSSVGAGGAEGADPWVYVVGPGCVRGAARVERRSREANAARKAAAAAAPGNISYLSLAVLLTAAAICLAPLTCAVARSDLVVAAYGFWYPAARS